jgi:ABC-type enterochelin transport system permease subunit
MTGIAFPVLLAGIATTVVGLILQAMGRAYFSRYKGDDTKELAAVVGFRVAAIFGIAVGIIFGSTAAHLLEAKKTYSRRPG